MKFYAKRPNQSRDNVLYVFMCTYFAFLLVISVHGDFEDVFWKEGVEIKARKGLQSNCNTKIRRMIIYSQLHPNLAITDVTGYNRFFDNITVFDNC